MSNLSLTRRSFLAATATAPLLSAAKKKIPVGLEMYSVRDRLTNDLNGTVDAVAKMGYQGVEFYSPYMQWTVDQAKDMRKRMDGLKIRCFSTHNGMNSLTKDIDKAIELNNTLGSKYIILASAGAKTIDDWKKVADTLNEASSKMKSAGLRTGFHNHQTEWKPIDGKKPLEVLADNTDKSVVLQLDVGTALETGNDPVAWINSHPGRIVSMHCKEWSKDTGYQALFGEGEGKWKAIFDAAEKKGGIEYYLIEQEGSKFSSIETAQKCLENFRKVRPA
jgi:sugar phosphate isomerase/epimerase